jgi:lysophospholipase L1-like esterase
MLLCALVAAAVAALSPATAAAARLYVAVGDSVGAGFGATSGHTAFDLYCAYLKSAAGRSLVDECTNESVPGLTTQAALDGGTIQKVVNDIHASTDTPVVTVVLGGNDLLGATGCQPITGPNCPFIDNMRAILDQLETALSGKPGPHVIQWLECYNPNHDNPFGNASVDQSTAELELGSDFALTPCSSYDLNLIGLNDAINCIAQEKGATPIDAYAPFQSSCTTNDCFSDSLHPNDKGYGLIFDALSGTPGRPVPATPPPDGTWPTEPGPAVLSALAETKKVFAPTGPHHKRGTVFSFRLDRSAAITITIARQSPGRRVGRTCVRPGFGLRHKPRCTLTLILAALGEQGRAGLNKIEFGGRVDGRDLKPESYLAVFTATDGSGTSTPRRLHFRIVGS